MTKMIAPEPKDTLLLYMSASHSAVSAALVLEKEVEGFPKQVPIYFVLEPSQAQSFSTQSLRI